MIGTNAGRSFADRRRLLVRRIRRAAPLIVVVCLVGLPIVLPTESAQPRQTLVRNQQIASAMSAAPWIVNHRWSGQATPVPAGAERILRPTAILSRTYRLIDEASAAHGRSALSQVAFVIVHCSDMRDMQGHYPPVCFPAQGWQARASRVMPLDAASLPSCRVARYDFDMGEALAGASRRTVLNLFLMPDGSIAPDLSRLNELKGSRTSAALGVAQVQMIFDQNPDDSECLATFREFVDDMPDLMSLLLGKNEESHDGTS